MIRPFIKISRKALVLGLELFAVFFLLAVLGLGTLFWRVNQGPLSIGFAKSYVEKALSDPKTETYVTFKDIVFSWPEFDQRFQLDISELRIQKGTAEASALTIDHVRVGLSRRALMIGLIRPVSVVVQSPALELVRGENGHLNLFVKNKKVEENETDATKSAEQQIVDLFRDMAGRPREGRAQSYFSRLHSFVISNATMVVRDHRFGVSWYLDDFDFVMDRQSKGVGVTLSVRLPAGGDDGRAGIVLDMVYRLKTDDFKLSGRVFDINPYILSRFLDLPDVWSGQDIYCSGHVEADFDNAFSLVRLSAQAEIPEGKIVLPNDYEKPISIEGIKLGAHFDQQKKTLKISNLEGKISGLSFKGEGEAKAKTGENFINLPLHLKIGSVPFETLSSFIPLSERDGAAYHWLHDRLTGGAYTDGVLDMTLSFQQKRDDLQKRERWFVSLPVFRLDFGFEKGSVRYSDTLMPATQAVGRGVLDLAADKLSIVGKGNLGSVVGEKVEVEIFDLLKKGAGHLIVRTDIKGPLSGALAYIAAEPIGFNKERSGIDYTTAQGNVSARVEVELPTHHETIPDEMVKVTVQGALTKVNVPALVNGLPLSGETFDLEVKEGSVTLKGEGKVGTAPTRFAYRHYYTGAALPYVSQVKASVFADESLRRDFGVNLSEYLKGTTLVTLTYTDHGDGKKDIEGTVDLKEARLSFPSLGYVKSYGAVGDASFKAYLKEDALQRISDLSIKADRLSISGGTLSFSQHENGELFATKGNFPKVSIDRSKMAASFDVGAKRKMNIAVKASVFDAAPFLQEADSGAVVLPDDGAKKGEDSKEDAEGSTSENVRTSITKSYPVGLSILAPRVLLENGQEAQNAKVSLDVDASGQVTRMEVDATIGASPFLLRFKPDETGKRTFRLRSDDAGSVLAGLGLYENMRGGHLIVYGEPKGNNLNGDLFGAARIEDFKVVNAPALTRLLSLMSLTGLSELLLNEGLAFSKLEAGFEWRFRPNGNLLVVKDGKTSGSSVGLTFEGVINRRTKTTDLSGTIIPMTEVNAILSKVPLLGELLVGKSGLIAATYSVSGPLNKLKIMVNPLSVLAPGFLRGILFEGGYKNKIPEDDAPSKPTSPPKQSPTRSFSKGSTAPPNSQ